MFRIKFHVIKALIATRNVDAMKYIGAITASLQMTYTSELLVGQFIAGIYLLPCIIKYLHTLIMVSNKLLHFMNCKQDAIMTCS